MVINGEGMVDCCSHFGVNVGILFLAKIKLSLKNSDSVAYPQSRVMPLAIFIWPDKPANQK